MLTSIFQPTRGTHLSIYTKTITRAFSSLLFYPAPSCSAQHTTATKREREHVRARSENTRKMTTKEKVNWVGMIYMGPSYDAFSSGLVFTLHRIKDRLGTCKLRRGHYPTCLLYTRRRARMRKGSVLDGRRQKKRPVHQREYVGGRLERAARRGFCIEGEVGRTAGWDKADQRTFVMSVVLANSLPRRHFPEPRHMVRGG